MFSSVGFVTRSLHNSSRRVAVKRGWGEGALLYCTYVSIHPTSRGNHSGKSQLRQTALTPATPTVHGATLLGAVAFTRILSGYWLECTMRHVLTAAEGKPCGLLHFKSRQVVHLKKSTATQCDLSGSYRPLSHHCPSFQPSGAGELGWRIYASFSAFSAPA